MKVSIIVPIHNTAPYLDRCVGSLAGQTHADLQILLVNDGSTDESEDICLAWAARDERVQYIPRPELGVSAARNAGLDAATGEYICFVDSDDCVLPGYVQTLLALCLAHGVLMAMCGYATNDGATPPHRVALPQESYTTEVIGQRDYFLRMYSAVSLPYVVIWNKIYHRSIWADLRYAEGKIQEDEGIIHHFVDRCDNIAVNYQPLYFYTQRPGSIMSRKQFYPGHMDIFPFLLERANYFMEKGEPELMFLTMKKYMLQCLSMYKRITRDAPNGHAYKKELQAMLGEALLCAGGYPVKDRRFLLKMQFYRLFPGAFRP